MAKIKENYTKAVVICHGKSEYYLARYITTNLHLNIKTFSNHKGKNSIQITSLQTVLDAKPFNKLSSLGEEYPIETTGKGKNKKPVGFKLFIIMDTDDCTEKQKRDFMDGTMFANHWLKDCIVPIYNINSLEDVMLDAGIMTQRIKTDEKGSYYEKIFPINQKPLANDTLEEVRTFREKIAKTKKSNLIEFVDYCLQLVAEGA